MPALEAPGRAVVLVALGLAASPVAIQTRSGDLLQITVDPASRRLGLRGPAVQTFAGEVCGDAGT